MPSATATRAPFDRAEHFGTQSRELGLFVRPFVAPAACCGVVGKETAMRFANIHGFFEAKSPQGVGAAIGLSFIERLAKKTLQRLAGKRVRGLNQEIPIFPITGVEAGFEFDPTNLKIETNHGTISFKLMIWLHLAGSAADRIVSFDFEFVDETIEITVDQAGAGVYFEPDPTANLMLSQQTVDPNADQHLKDGGFVDASGNADWTRFNNEVLFPFLWINSRGLIRSIFRSIPLPQLFKLFRCILPVAPFYAQIESGHLCIWTDRATAVIPGCGGENPVKDIPAKTWEKVTGVAFPWSPRDENEPAWALYYSAPPIIDWHADVFRPAVAIHTETDGFVGFSVDAALSLESLRVVFNPSAVGGTISAFAGLRAAGYASAWINGPCGIRTDVATTALTGNGGAAATFALAFDNPGQKLDANLAITADIDRGSVNLTTGGVLGFVVGEIVELLYKTGTLRIDSSYEHRSQTMLLDYSSLGLGNLDLWQRVSEDSILVGIQLDL